MAVCGNPDRTGFANVGTKSKKESEDKKGPLILF